MSTFASTLLWIWFYLFIGRRYGTSFKHLIPQSIGVTITVVVCIVVVIIGLHIYGSRHTKNND